MRPKNRESNNMQDKDWLSRWQKNQIGFHDTQVNEHLTQHVFDFDLKSGDTVFLPLCGKSSDIAWLAQQGFQVIGVELSSIAIQSFFAEQELLCQQVESERFVMRRSGNICLLEGNFFDLQREDLGECNLVYDRAALIALDQPNRQRYVDWMLSIIGENSNILLITLDYDQSEMNGPPFAVSQAEVASYYEKTFQIDIVTKTDIVDESPRWRVKGLSSLIETVYQLSRK
jgi:thiopurine S-methyltransferase